MQLQIYTYIFNVYVAEIQRAVCFSLQTALLSIQL